MIRIERKLTWNVINRIPLIWYVAQCSRHSPYYINTHNHIQSYFQCIRAHKTNLFKWPQIYGWFHPFPARRHTEYADKPPENTTPPINSPKHVIHAVNPIVVVCVCVERLCVFVCWSRCVPSAVTKRSLPACCCFVGMRNFRTWCGFARLSRLYYVDTIYNIAICTPTANIRAFTSRRHYAALRIDADVVSTISIGNILLI